MQEGIPLVALAYGLGCLNAGYYVLRWRDGRDLRTLGSGNAGARNAGRILGRRAFALVFMLDATKGALAVLAAQTWAPDVVPLCAVSVTLGHVFPVQLGGRGGKGVATALGATAVLDVLALAAMAGVFGLARLARLGAVPAGLLAFAAGTAFAFALRASGIGFTLLALTVLLGFTHRHSMPPGRSAAAGNPPEP